MVNLGNSWDGLLKQEFESEYYLNLREFLKAEYAAKVIFPPMDEIFSALKATSYEDCKVVILGQDPYHEPGQAHGMAFSVKPGIKQPPSMVNIFKELKDDLKIEPPPKDYGYLIDWANQGVLLLNTVLTVRAHEANSHRNRGWEKLTDRIIEILSDRDKPMVFMLWGRNAQNKKKLINDNRHLVLEGNHPSPLSAYGGFFGGKYFSKANEFLKNNGIEEIDWEIRPDL